MPWNTVTMPGIQSAMTLCDHMGLDLFRNLYGTFQAAHDVHMYWYGRGPYEARPLLAAAYSHLFPSSPHIQPNNFANNDAHNFLVNNFGFEMRNI